MEKKNKRHDAIFWPIFVLLLGILVVFLVSGCLEKSLIYHPDLQEKDNFTIIARQYFHTPAISTSDGRAFIGYHDWDIYKIKYEDHYYTLWMIDHEPVSITPDLLHESSATPANNTPYSNLDYESIFGKK